MIIWAFFFVKFILNMFIYSKPTIIWLNVPLLLNSTFPLSVILSQLQVRNDSKSVVVTCYAI